MGAMFPACARCLGRCCNWFAVKAQHCSDTVNAYACDPAVAPPPSNQGVMQRAQEQGSTEPQFARVSRGVGSEAPFAVHNNTSNVAPQTSASPLRTCGAVTSSAMADAPTSAAASAAPQQPPCHAEYCPDTAAAIRDEFTQTSWPSSPCIPHETLSPAALVHNSASRCGSVGGGSSLNSPHEHFSDRSTQMMMTKADRPCNHMRAAPAGDKHTHRSLGPAPRPNDRVQGNQAGAQPTQAELDDMGLDAASMNAEWGDSSFTECSAQVAPRSLRQLGLQSPESRVRLHFRFPSYSGADSENGASLPPPSLHDQACTPTMAATDEEALTPCSSSSRRRTARIRHGLERLAQLRERVAADAEEGCEKHSSRRDGRRTESQQNRVEHAGSPMQQCNLYGLSSPQLNRHKLCCDGQRHKDIRGRREMSGDKVHGDLRAELSEGVDSPSHRGISSHTACRTAPFILGRPVASNEHSRHQSSGGGGQRHSCLRGSISECDRSARHTRCHIAPTRHHSCGPLLDESDEEYSSGTPGIDMSDEAYVQELLCQVNSMLTDLAVGGAGASRADSAGLLVGTANREHRSGGGYVTVHSREGTSSSGGLGFVRRREGAADAGLPGMTCSQKSGISRIAKIGLHVEEATRATLGRLASHATSHAAEAFATGDVRPALSVSQRAPVESELAAADSGIMRSGTYHQEGLLHTAVATGNKTSSIDDELELERQYRQYYGGGRERSSCSTGQAHGACVRRPYSAAEALTSIVVPRTLRHSTAEAQLGGCNGPAASNIPPTHTQLLGGHRFVAFNNPLADSVTMLGSGGRPVSLSLSEPSSPVRSAVRCPSSIRFRMDDNSTADPVRGTRLTSIGGGSGSSEKLNRKLLTGTLFRPLSPPDLAWAAGRGEPYISCGQRVRRYDGSGSQHKTYTTYDDERGSYCNPSTSHNSATYGRALLAASYASVPSVGGPTFPVDTDIVTPTMAETPAVHRVTGGISSDCSYPNNHLMGADGSKSGRTFGAGVLRGHQGADSSSPYSHQAHGTKTLTDKLRQLTDAATDAALRLRAFVPRVALLKREAREESSLLGVRVPQDLQPPSRLHGTPPPTSRTSLDYMYANGHSSPTSTTTAPHHPFPNRLGQQQHQDTDLVTSRKKYAHRHHSYQQCTSNQVSPSKPFTILSGRQIHRNQNPREKTLIRICPTSPILSNGSVEAGAEKYGGPPAFGHWSHPQRVHTGRENIEQLLPQRSYSLGRQRPAVVLPSSSHPFNPDDTSKIKSPLIQILSKSRCASPLGNANLGQKSVDDGIRKNAASGTSQVFITTQAKTSNNRASTISGYSATTSRSDSNTASNVTSVHQQVQEQQPMPSHAPEVCPRSDVASQRSGAAVSKVSGYTVSTLKSDRNTASSVASVQQQIQQQEPIQSHMPEVRARSDMASQRSGAAVSKISGYSATTSSSDSNTASSVTSVHQQIQQQQPIQSHAPKARARSDVASQRSGAAVSKISGYTASTSKSDPKTANSVKSEQQQMQQQQPIQIHVTEVRARSDVASQRSGATVSKISGYTASTLKSDHNTTANSVESVQQQQPIQSHAPEARARSDVASQRSGVTVSKISGYTASSSKSDPNTASSVESAQKQQHIQSHVTEAHSRSVVASQRSCVTVSKISGYTASTSKSDPNAASSVTSVQQQIHQQQPIQSHVTEAHARSVVASQRSGGTVASTFRDPAQEREQGLPTRHQDESFEDLSMKDGKGSEASKDVSRGGGVLGEAVEITHRQCSQ